MVEKGASVCLGAASGGLQMVPETEGLGSIMASLSTRVVLLLFIASQSIDL